jgi:hypothetical protein
MPISPQARRCDNAWVVIAASIISRFTAGRSRFLPVRPCQTRAFQAANERTPKTEDSLAERVEFEL